MEINIFAENYTFEESEIPKNLRLLSSLSIEQNDYANPKHSGTMYQKNPQELENFCVLKKIKNLFYDNHKKFLKFVYL